MYYTSYHHTTQLLNHWYHDSVTYAHTNEACRCKHSEHAQEGGPQKRTIPYLWAHSVAFKYNVADLNTVCYSVKLQGDSEINI